MVSPLMAMYCVGLSITFHFIYNNYMNFCLKMLRPPSNPAKNLDLPEDYKTSCQFFILLYFVFCFSLLLQTDCVASNQPLTFTYFHRKYLSFPCLTVIHELFLNRKQILTFLQNKMCHTNSLYNCCNGVY